MEGTLPDSIQMPISMPTMIMISTAPKTPLPPSMIPSSITLHLKP